MKVSSSFLVTCMCACVHVCACERECLVFVKDCKDPNFVHISFIPILVFLSYFYLILFMKREYTSY